MRDRGGGRGEEATGRASRGLASPRIALAHRRAARRLSRCEARPDPDHPKTPARRKSSENPASSAQRVERPALSSHHGSPTPTRISRCPVPRDCPWRSAGSHFPRRPRSARATQAARKHVENLRRKSIRILPDGQSLSLRDPDAPCKSVGVDASDQFHLQPVIQPASWPTRPRPGRTIQGNSRRQRQLPARGLSICGSESGAGGIGRGACTVAMVKLPGAYGKRAASALVGDGRAARCFVG